MTHWYAQFSRPLNTKLVINTREFVVTSRYLMCMIDDKWFKTAQRRAGVTAEDVAKRLGKDRSLVSRIYVGRQPMKLEEAKVFSEVLGVPLDEILRRAGVADEPTAQVLMPGFYDSDAAAWVPKPGEGGNVQSVAATFGARPGVDIWRVRSRSMELQGLLPGDFMLVDTHAAERTKAGDVVIAQVYDNAKGRAATVLRRYEPPVLTSASMDPEERRMLIVDGVNVVVRGRVAASWRML